MKREFEMKMDMLEKKQLGSGFFFEEGSIPKKERDLKTFVSTKSSKGDKNSSLKTFEEVLDEESEK